MHASAPMGASVPLCFLCAAGGGGGVAEKRLYLFSAFPCVCPEPVLVKMAVFKFQHCNKNVPQKGVDFFAFCHFLCFWGFFLGTNPWRRG
jgi:hypothetical protein